MRVDGLAAVIGPDLRPELGGARFNVLPVFAADLTDVQDPDVVGFSLRAPIQARGHGKI